MLNEDGKSLYDYGIQFKHIYPQIDISQEQAVENIMKRTKANEKIFQLNTKQR